MATDGREGIEIFREHADDLACVLLDLTMPHMSGEQTLEAIRAIRPDVRVVLSSGYDKRSATKRFAEKGLAGFVQKPYQKATLLAKIRAAVES